MILRTNIIDQLTEEGNIRKLLEVIKKEKDCFTAAMVFLKGLLQMLPLEKATEILYNFNLICFFSSEDYETRVCVIQFLRLFIGFDLVDIFMELNYDCLIKLALDDPSRLVRYHGLNILRDLLLSIDNASLQHSTKLRVLAVIGELNLNAIDQKMSDCLPNNLYPAYFDVDLDSLKIGASENGFMFCYDC